MNNLLTKCNADVYKAILEIKESQPETGEKLIAILQEHEYYSYMNFEDVVWFAAYLPYEIWDCKVHTFHLLFQSKQTTTMP
jgi:hypothetical protein